MTRYDTLPIPLPPHTQALHSTTFKPPPLDGSLTFHEIYDWHYENSPNHPLFVYRNGDGSERTIHWSEAIRAIHCAGGIVRSRVKTAQLEHGSSPKQLVVAILSLADTISYYTIVMGIIRAGMTAFPISPRNSPAAIAHLLSKTNVTHMLIGGEQSLKTLASASLNLIDHLAVSIPTQSVMPVFEDLYIDQNGVTFEPLPLEKPSLNDAAVILHSSGSTAFPKPITWTHHRFLQFVAQPYYGQRDVTGKRISYHAIPIFHSMGIIMMGWTASVGLTLTVFKPTFPAAPIIPESVITASIDLRSELIFCVPSFIEAWFLNPDHVADLKKFEGVLTGGGPLNKEAGDSLIEQGVSLCFLYGTTELGMPAVLNSSGVRKDWEYFQISPQVKLIAEANFDGLVELVVAPNSRHSPCVFNGIRGDINVYETSDLLYPHPSKKGYWKIIGRADDQIMHSTGEKTNPTPLEKIISQDPHILSSVMFGRGQFNAGILIDPTEELKFNPANTKKLEEFRNTIWPTVERMNEYAPQHSRVFKEMIIVSSPSKPFTYTVKNTARRQAIIKDYESEIEDLYIAVAETSQSKTSPPTTWSEANSLQFLRTIVSNVLKHPVKDADDLFQNGCDSLQATWIRNSILQALRASTTSSTREISANVVYEHPSISALAHFASRFANSSSKGGSDPTESKIQEMLLMVEKYSQSFPQHHPSRPTPSQDVVLVTGTTGGLGSNILAELVASKDVARVFAINRKDSNGTVSVIDRQVTALNRQGLDPSIISSPKVEFVETDVDTQYLGLPDETYELIRESTTHIIHNAWRVDFNLALQSFEPQIKGMRNLIDLALSSPHATPPRLIFTSSVGVLRQCIPSGPVEEIPVGPEVAAGSGYGESKWVSERLLEVAAATTALKSTSIRVGQICGGPNGFWNEKEWLPSLVRSSIELNCLPDSEQPITWIPSAIAAKVVAEMRISAPQVVHLTHPRPVLWSTIFKVFSSALNIQLVSYAEWLARLEISASVNSSSSAELEADTIRSNPALRLINFFRGVSMDLDSSREALGIPMLSLDEAKKVSSTLQGGNLRELGTEDVLRWLGYWRSSSFLLL